MTAVPPSSPSQASKLRAPRDPAGLEIKSYAKDYPDGARSIDLQVFDGAQNILFTARSDPIIRSRTSWNNVRRDATESVDNIFYTLLPSWLDLPDSTKFALKYSDRTASLFLQKVTENPLLA